MNNLIRDANKLNLLKPLIKRNQADSIHSYTKQLLKCSTQNTCFNENGYKKKSTVSKSTKMPHSENQKFLTMDNLSPAVKNVQYAVRGPIVIRAGQIEEELKKGVKKNFDRVIRANIGDCHATGQKPITFLRQVMGLATLPELLNDDKYPSDVKERVNRILADCKGGSVGAYTDSAGLAIVKKDVSEYIKQRDGGISSDPDDIFLTTGASDGIKITIELLLNDIKGKPAGFMIPIPQYPLYSATIAEYNSEQVGYYLDEDNGWALNVDELQRAYDASLDKCVPRAICVINPGNPTGQVLSRQNIEEIIKFAHKNRLFILADEVYQHNVYPEGMEFHSFKKVAYELGSPYREMELASFFSVSKGYMGECGARAGYMEIINMDPDVKAQLKKLSSAKLCSSVVGQACMDAVVNPPKPGEPSYDLFIKEKTAVLEGLKEKGRLVTELFNSIEGIKCNPVQGAMYAFPRITIPQKAIDHARSKNMEPDAFYCFELLENTGICVVPGSGFQQRPGTFHFRTTILPPIEEIKTLLAKFKEFHLKFVKDWSN